MQGTGVSCELMFITRLYPTLCDLMGCSTPGIPVPYCLLEFAQVYIHCISDAIQPSHSLMPSSPSALDVSQHQELLQVSLLSAFWSSNDQNTGASVLASVLPVSIQG